MAKKARSQPMMEMLNRLTSFTSSEDDHESSEDDHPAALQEFRTVFFEEEMLLHAPIEEWPMCAAQRSRLPRLASPTRDRAERA